MNNKINVLEIGAWGGSNVLDEYRGITGLAEKTNIYTSVNIDPDLHPEVTELRNITGNAIIQLMTANFANADVGANSQDRIYCGNVLGAPNYIGDVGVFMGRIFRALKSNGIGVIWETTTPQYFGGRGLLKSSEDIKKILLKYSQELGFRKVLFIDATSPDWDKMVKEWLPKTAQNKHSQSARSYLILLTK